jgi:trans-aconitate methyltransferase
MTATLDAHVAAYAGGSIYDFDNGVILNWYPHRIIEATNGARSLLELGLGHGITTPIFAKAFERHVVLEGSSSVIENFKKKHPESTVEIVDTYFENYETTERFDVIVMGFVLEHVDDPIAIMTRFRSFLAPGGKLYVAVPNAEALNRRLGHYAGLLEDMETLSDNDRLQGHQRYYTIRTFSDDVEKAGLRIDLLEGLYLKPFTTKQILALNLDERIIHAMCVAGVDYPELSLGLLARVSPLSQA